jgi:hypothetical protein
MKVGPRIEMAHPKTLLDDEEMCKILPFLALPDGAHLVRHLTVQSKPAPSESTVVIEQGGLLLLPYRSIEATPDTLVSASNRLRNLVRLSLPSKSISQI